MFIIRLFSEQIEKLGFSAEAISESSKKETKFGISLPDDSVHPIYVDDLVNSIQVRFVLFFFSCFFPFLPLFFSFSPLFVFHFPLFFPFPFPLLQNKTKEIYFTYLNVARSSSIPYSLTTASSIFNVSFFLPLENKRCDLGNRGCAHTHASRYARF
jgi:hypothetical protein